AEQRPSQYSYSLQGIQQQQPAQPEGVTYVPEVTRGYFTGRSDIQEIPQKQIIDQVPVASTVLSYYEQQQASVPTSQAIETYTQPTGTLDYTREVYESQKPIYDYQSAEQRPSQYSYSLQGIQQQQPAQPEGVTYVPEVTRGYFT
ncbi:unnamed protein product, partial [Rotaria sp. Silwood2]